MAPWLKSAKKAQKNAGLEEKLGNVSRPVRRFVDDYVRNLSQRLIREQNNGSQDSIEHIVQNQYVIENQRNGYGNNLSNTPLYVYAFIALKEKAAELAPGFLSGYQIHINHQNRAGRFIHSGISRLPNTLTLGFLASTCTASSTANVTLTLISVPIAWATGYFGTLYVESIVNRRANLERKAFENAVKAEFYRVARGS